MFNHAPEGYDCPLCHIARGEQTKIGSQEASVVYRDEQLTAFIADKFWRAAPGHVMIITNEHIENIYDLHEDLGHAVFDLSKRVAIALKQSYGCAGVSTRQHNEPAGNQGAWHFHLHVFPRTLGDELYLNHRDTYWPTAAEKQPYADKLKPLLRVESANIDAA